MWSHLFTYFSSGYNYNPMVPFVQLQCFCLAGRTLRRAKYWIGRVYIIGFMAHFSHLAFKVAEWSSVKSTMRSGITASSRRTTFHVQHRVMGSRRDPFAAGRVVFRTRTCSLSCGSNKHRCRVGQVNNVVGVIIRWGGATAFISKKW